MMLQWTKALYETVIKYIYEQSQDQTQNTSSGPLQLQNVFRNLQTGFAFGTSSYVHILGNKLYKTL